MRDEKNKMLERVNGLAAAMLEKTGSLRIAFGEADQTTESEPEAAHFLKRKELRLGRDFELYAFMANVSSEAYVTTSLLEELVLPLAGSQIDQAAYDAGLAYLRDQGDVFGSNKQEWENLIDQFARPPSPSSM